VVSSQQRREQVTLCRQRGHSARRACELIGISRSMLGYRAVRPVRDVLVVQKIRELARQYPRFGYRMIRIFLGRAGHAMNPKRTYRLWAAAGLQLPRKRPRRRVADPRPRPESPTGPNHVWAYDFVFDRTSAGQNLKCLTIIDEFTRESLAIDVGGSIRSRRVIDVLARLISLRGAPTHLRSDNGPEFVSLALQQWIADNGMNIVLNDPGKPWQNGTNESFNGTLRDECLSIEWFRSRAEAKVVIETWRRHYNDVRPHSSLGYLTPTEFHQQYQTPSTPGAVPQL
jgi:putative transposase